MTYRQQTGQRSQAPGYRLAGRQVTADMYDVAERAKRAGHRVLLTLGEAAEGNTMQRTGHCTNCEGFGKLALQTIVGGPFKSVPPYVREKGIGQEEGPVLAAPGWHNGAWYQMSMRLFACPLCHGHGNTKDAPAPAYRPALPPVAEDVPEPELELWL